MKTNKKKKLIKNTKSRQKTYAKYKNVDHNWYKTKLIEQDNKCFICCNPPKNLPLAIDHDHKSGETRGLLCFRCNKFLVGMIERYKNPEEVLINLILYFEKYSLRGHRPQLLPKLTVL